MIAFYVCVVIHGPARDKQIQISVTLFTVLSVRFPLDADIYKINRTNNIPRCFCT